MFQATTGSNIYHTHSYLDWVLMLKNTSLSEIETFVVLPPAPFSDVSHDVQFATWQCFKILKFRLGCACNHVVTLLFKLQACKKSRQRAHPAQMTQILFKRRKKTDLVPDVIADVPHQLPSFYVRGDVNENDIETKEKLLELKKLSPNAVVLKSVLIESDDIDYDSEATISSDEWEHCIPEHLTSFYEPNAINFRDEKLETYSRSAYNTFIRC